MVCHFVYDHELLSRLASCRLAPRTLYPLGNVCRVFECFDLAFELKEFGVYWLRTMREIKVMGMCWNYEMEEYNVDMNTVSRTITGSVMIALGISICIGAFIKTLWLLVEGVPMLILGVFILLNKKEDQIEQIKNQDN